MKTNKTKTNINNKQRTHKRIQFFWFFCDEYDILVYILHRSFFTLFLFCLNVIFYRIEKFYFCREYKKKTTRSLHADREILIRCFSNRDCMLYVSRMYTHTTIQHRFECLNTARLITWVILLSVCFSLSVVVSALVLSTHTYIYPRNILILFGCVWKILPICCVFVFFLSCTLRFDERAFCCMKHRWTTHWERSVFTVICYLSPCFDPIIFVWEFCMRLYEAR